METQHPVILFDGICNLCNASVQFVIKRDPQQKFRFASLQGNFGQRFLEQHAMASGTYNSFILWENNTVFTRSAAALKVAKRLNGLWPALYACIIIPPFIRNAVYDWVARNRYQWFGTTENCPLPTPSTRSLFLD